MIFILDSSAFFSGIQPQEMDESATTPFIISEIRDSQAKIRIESAVNSGTLKILEPENNFLKLIEKEAQKSGDSTVLSQADKSILALALQIKSRGGKVIIITDDYAVMNLSSIIGIEYRSTFEKGIQRIIIWENVCSGCFKKYPPEYNDPCEVCGSNIKRRKRKKKR